MSEKVNNMSDEDNTFIITGAFCKKVGRREPRLPLTPENVAKVMPTEDGMKSTVGGTFSNGKPEDTAIVDDFHLTFGCITNQNDLAPIQAHANADDYIGMKVKTVACAIFEHDGIRDTAVLIKLTKASDAEKLRALNATCTPEGETDERILHFTIPVMQDENGNWVKRFDDVSDEKFKFCKDLLTTLPLYVGKSDEELLAIINM
jgi:hypothetical protein